jgi:SWI/SNF-related matrix-associated actin-dependent regulator of chromatin subfamily A-like protein 1
MRNKFPELYKALWPYQRVGVRRLNDFNGRAILADSPGLGKTIQAVGYLAMNTEARPAIIVCPAIAKHHWKNTATKWLKNDKIVMLSGRTPYDLNEGTIFIINYDILTNQVFVADGDFCFLRYPDADVVKMKATQKVELPYSGWIDYLSDLNAKCLIVDEFQRMSNRKTLRTNAISQIVKKMKHFIPVSGTPSENRPRELYTTLSWLVPHLFPNERTYQMRYCAGKHNGFGWDFNGASNIPELFSILKEHVMIRRTKKEVMKDLPAKIRSIVPLDIDNRKEYTRAEESFSEWLRLTKGKSIAQGEHLVKLEALKQLATKGKMKLVLEWIEEYLESGEKLVVFAEHKKTVDMIMQKFNKIAVKVVGGIKQADREKAEKEFQTNDKVRLFVGNIQAAGVSLTLTKANAVAMVELPDTPAQLEQAEDRVYGRVNDCHGATIYFLVAVDSIEEDIAAMLDRKAQVLTAMYDGEKVAKESLLSELIKKRFK